MALPVKPSEDLNKGFQDQPSVLRKRIFAMFRHWPDDRSGILLRGNFEAIRLKYLNDFTASEIQSELENMERDGYLKIVRFDFHLTDKGKTDVFG